VPRRNRPERRPQPELRSALGSARRENGPDGDWLVRAVPGSAGDKTYRCPGCHQTIPPGIPHVVAWPADGGAAGTAGADDRRHWHSSCWSARHHRR